jgi:hypothetical protein
MKKILLAASVLVALNGAASAYVQEGMSRKDANFGAFPTFKLVCESTAINWNNINDKKRVWFEVVPSEAVVKMTNMKGETFSFAIEQVFMSQTQMRNEFDNYVLVTYPVWIWFKDSAGKWRHIKTDQQITYAPRGPGNIGPYDDWAPYNCLPL